MTDPVTIDRLREALKEYGYKYFGHYELSDKQWDAVMTIAKFAQDAVDENDNKLRANSQKTS